MFIHHSPSFIFKFLENKNIVYYLLWPPRILEMNQWTIKLSHLNCVVTWVIWPSKKWSFWSSPLSSCIHHWVIPKYKLYKYCPLISHEKQNSSVGKWEIDRCHCKVKLLRALAASWEFHWPGLAVGQPRQKGTCWHEVAHQARWAAHPHPLPSEARASKEKMLCSSETPVTRKPGPNPRGLIYKVYKSLWPCSTQIKAGDRNNMSVSG